WTAHPAVAASLLAQYRLAQGSPMVRGRRAAGAQIAGAKLAEETDLTGRLESTIVPKNHLF
ncbi:hypothetical protein ACO1K9_13725, partial [Staphylococcus aureus]